MSADPALVRALLEALAPEPEGIALARLCKRLGVRMSVLLRTLAWLGQANLDGRAGPGWIRMQMRGEREVAVLTAAGRAQLAR
ncbi:hypothetical protein [Xanthomonas theicola]|uniref:Uncharacterized protein n=1 Tax=Xanthomonas theicola TaxID=56464 RepID=A0A2S6ZI77_9XANT|nr:hypothetical protein [Xanthomonas theicola]PPT91964.1 hypothetical protein XthCFBP4691_05805 [Xanthomonas theicola]QNH24969.1 hypothetical protein G4Q83_09730 [Xanthomonas theicola]